MWEEQQRATQAFVSPRPRDPYTPFPRGEGSESESAAAGPRPPRASSVIDEDSNFSLADFMNLQSMPWSEASSRRASTGGPSTNPPPPPFNEVFLDSIGRTSLSRPSGQNALSNNYTSAAPPLPPSEEAKEPPRTSGSSGYVSYADFKQRLGANGSRPYSRGSSSSHLVGRGSGHPPSGPSDVPVTAVIENFYRACLRVERDIEADEQYLHTIARVESELKQLLRWARELHADITGTGGGNKSGGATAAPVPPAAGGGRRMENDLRLLGDVLKRLEMSEKVLAPLERTHLTLLRKYILQGTQMPTVTEAELRSFAAACAAEDEGKDEGNVPGMHMVDAILLNSAGGGEGSDPRSRRSQPWKRSSDEVAAAMRDQLASFQARREEVRRRLLNELLFKNKNEGCGGGADRPRLPTEALEEEERCVRSGRASDLGVLLKQSPYRHPHTAGAGTVRGGDDLYQDGEEHPLLSLEEEPILMVNIANSAAPLPNSSPHHDDDDSDNEGRGYCSSPGYLAQLQQFSEFQRQSYRFPGSSGDEDSDGRPSYFTVITTPARFACFHVIETSREILCNLQRRVGALLAQRDAHLAKLRERAAQLDPYDPQQAHLDEERSRLEGEMGVMTSWQSMMRKLWGKVMVPLRERIVAAILQQAIVRKGLLEVLAQRLNDGTSSAAGGTAPRVGERSSGILRDVDANNAVYNGGIASLSMAAVAASKEKISLQTEPSADEDRFSNRVSNAANMQRPDVVGPVEPPLPRASAVFVSMLEDIAREQARLLDDPSRRTAAPDPAACPAEGVSGGGTSRKRDRAEMEREGTEAEAEAKAEAEAESPALPPAAADPFLELDVSTATPSREPSTNGSAHTTTPAPPAKDQQPQSDNGIATFFQDAAPEAEGTALPQPQLPVACDEPQRDEEAQVGSPDADSDADEASVSDEETPLQLPPHHRERAPRKRTKRVYGLRTLVGGGGAGKDGRDPTDDTDSDVSDESGGGGGLWKGLGAFVKAVVHRATTFSDSDSDGEEVAPRAAKRRRV